MARYSGTSGDDIYEGGAEADIIHGLGGDDRLSGGDGADRLEGGAGNDILLGGEGADTLIGGLGDDVYFDHFTPEDGATIVELAGEGIDEIRTRGYIYSLAGLPHIENLTSDGAGYEHVTLTGNALANRITGGLGNDVLDGAGGGDTLIGGEGGDVASFVAPSGLTGSLELIPVGSSGDFDVELSTGNATEILFQVRLGGGSRTVTGVGSAAAMGTTLLVEMEAVQFRAASDPVPQVWQSLGQPVFDGIAGTPGSDLFAGTAGADRYHGYGGDDDISGQAGSDWIEGGSGKDRLRGGADHDFLLGGGGDDSLEGEDGHDNLSGGEGDDLLLGGTGSDMLNSGAGSDVVRGGIGNDVLIDTGGGHDRLFGEDGNDRFIVSRSPGSAASIVEIDGGAGWDQLTLNVAAPGLVHADMGAGDSYITIERMESDLTLMLGDGRTILNFTGEAADSQLRGSITILGFTPSDHIDWGTYFWPLLTDWDPGPSGNPFASGHLQWRQSGADALLEIDFDGGWDSFTTLITFSDVTATRFSEIGRYSPVRIDEGDGTYTYVAGREMTVLTAGPGDDDIYLGSWYLNVVAGAGDDRIFADWLFADYSIDGGAGTDELIVGRNQDSPIGNLHGIEILTLLSGYYPWFGQISGGPRTYAPTMLDSALASGATLRVGAAGLAADERFDLDATAETDGRYEIVGNAAGNLLRTGAGDDRIDGGAGADTMRGGGGDDVYIVDQAGDLVEEEAGQGADEIRTALATYSLAALPNVENLTGTSATGQTLAGNSGNNVITGGGGKDNLRLQDGGDDTVLAGGGDDNIYFIGSLTAADAVNGGTGNDTLVLQGDYTGGLTLSANVTDIELVSILAGSNTNFGEPGTNRHDYVLTVNDANFSGAIQVRVNGSALLAGEDFTFDGSAELDSRFVVYGGRGKDTLTGSRNNDIFFLAEERFATGDTVNGGAGYDGMFLRGNYTIDFNAPGYTGLFTNIENLTLTSATDERYARGGGTEFDYNLVLSDAIVKPGETLTVSGTLLMANETMILDAGAETDGFLSLFGGKAGDTLKGGGQADLIHGSLGADLLTGNGGADVFRYNAAAESTNSSLDHILDFAAGVDKIDLARLDADTLTAGNQAFTWIGSSAFSGTAGELRAGNSNGLGWFLEGDTDGDGSADFAVRLTLEGPSPLSGSDFLL